MRQTILLVGIFLCALSVALRAQPTPPVAEPESDIATWWKTFAPGQRDALLKIMTPEQKHTLRALIEQAAQHEGATQKDAGVSDTAVPLGTSEQQAIEQLRTLAEAIRKCPDQQPPPGKSGIRVSAPLNVTWNLEQVHSARSQKMGYVEFVQTFSDVHVRAPLEQCKKGDSACKARNQASEMAELDIAARRPLRLKFEFGMNSI